MQRGARILALTWVLSGACSNSDSSNTKIMVVVWSNLAVPTEMDTIRIDVHGSSTLPPATFPLTAGNDGGKTRLPVVMELVSPDNKAVAFEVVASGLLGKNPVVSQTANLSFDPGHSRVLTLFLDHACMGATSGPCAQPVNVDASKLPEYPQTLFLPPDGSAGGIVDAAGGSVETGGADHADDRADVPRNIDAAVDTAIDILVPDARQTGDVAPDAGTEVSADVPLLFDAPLDTPSDPLIPDDVGQDLAIPDGVPACDPLTTQCTQPVDSAADNSVVDAGSDASGGTPDSRDAALDTAHDLNVPAEVGRDLAVPDGASACVLPMTICTGLCIDPQTSPGNCGGCGRPCGTQNGTPGCAAGACSMSACGSGFLDCSADENTSRDGCETNGNTDSANCGRCGNVCSSKVCRSQACLATARYGNTGAGSSASPFSANFLAGIQVYIPNASVVTGLGAVLYGATASCDMYLGLYRDIAGSPGALVATVAAPAKVAPGGKELAVNPPIDVLAGTYWILGVWDGLASFSSNSTTAVNWLFAPYPYGALPSTAPTSMTPASLPPPNLYVIVAQ
jgi:hypothetical protein